MGPVATFVTGQGLGTLFDAAVSLPFKALLKKRLEGAREVLLEEVRSGRTFTTEGELEDVAAMALRYARAAEEGAARRNLRLMARVMSGLIEGAGLYADEFLRWADVIASLSREEIITAVTMFEAKREQEALGVEEAKVPGYAMGTISRRLVGPGLIFSQTAELMQTMNALTRTGLVIGNSGYGAFYSSPRMAEFVRLAQLEGVDLAD